VIRRHYLLDTDISIYCIKRRPSEVAQRLAGLPPGSAGLSVITYGELWRGVQRSQQYQRNLDALMQLISILPVTPLPIEAGKHYGRIRSTLERAGTPIGNNDLWIAAHALAENLILVTNNEREFARIDGLRLENWVS
jgi:tRNA(fMet)-specific endonuclease VapC